MIKITLLFLIAATSFLGTAYAAAADAAPAAPAAPGISGDAIEKEVEDILTKIKKDIEDFKKSHPDAKDALEELQGTLAEAERIKALNDARHHFSDAMKFVNDEQLKGLVGRLEKIMATADLQVAMSKLTGAGSAAKNKGKEEGEEEEEDGDDEEEEGDEEGGADDKAEDE